MFYETKIKQNSKRKDKKKEDITKKQKRGETLWPNWVLAQLRYQAELTPAPLFLVAVAVADARHGTGRRRGSHPPALAAYLTTATPKP